MVSLLFSFRCNYLLGSFVYCVRKILRTCAYQEVRNVSFSENFANVLSELFFRNISKFTFVLLLLKVHDITNHHSLFCGNIFQNSIGIHIKETSPSYQKTQKMLQKTRCGDITLCSNISRPPIFALLARVHKEIIHHLIPRGASGGGGWGWGSPLPLFFLKIERRC